ncbi:MAG: hypothetical protein ACI87E_000405 [Mariniblastus sp.]|jgi:hypothetical protein
MKEQHAVQDDYQYGVGCDQQRHTLGHLALGLNDKADDNDDDWDSNVDSEAFLPSADEPSN